MRDNETIKGLRYNGPRTSDHLHGRPGDDHINGKAGADILEGGPGNDVYFVDDGHDDVVELAGQGEDTVHTTALSYALSANVENLYASASGRGHSTFTGNDGGNTIQGSDNGDDLLSGGRGADTLFGQEGDDYLIGGAEPTSCRAGAATTHSSWRSTAPTRSGTSKARWEAARSLRHDLQPVHRAGL